MQKVSLACTGGGVKSAVNIGAIRALEDLGIRINAISGASLGGCVASLYAMGYEPEEILEMFKKNKKKWGRFTVKDIVCALPSLFIKGGLKNPKKIPASIKEVGDEQYIETMDDFGMPVIIPALDLTHRETIYYSSRPLKGQYTYYTDRTIFEAIRSTCALPIIYTPNEVKIDNSVHHMLDGGTTTNTPVTALRQFSDYVIGVTTKYYGTKQRQKINFFTGFTETFQSMRRSSLYYQKQEADLWIEVDIKKVGIFAKKEALSYCEQCGYDAIMDAVKSGRLVLEERGKRCIG